MRSAVLFLAIVLTVSYCIVVSRLRRLFLSDRYFLITVRGPRTSCVPQALAACGSCSLSKNKISAAGCSSIASAHPSIPEGAFDSPPDVVLRSRQSTARSTFQLRDYPLRVGFIAKEGILPRLVVRHRKNAKSTWAQIQQKPSGCAQRRLIIFRCWDCEKHLPGGYVHNLPLSIADLERVLKPFERRFLTICISQQNSPVSRYSDCAADSNFPGRNLPYLLTGVRIVNGQISCPMSEISSARHA